MTFVIRLQSYLSFAMEKEKFPYLATIIGIILSIVVFKGSGLREEGRTVLPLLTLLVVSEFGAIVTAIGSYLGARQFLSTRKFTAITAMSLLCALLCCQFVIRGILLWPK